MQNQVLSFLSTIYYDDTFDFLFNYDKLHSLDDDNLKSRCNVLESALKKDDQSDIDGNELYTELKLFVHLLPKKRCQLLKY